MNTITDSLSNLSITTTRLSFLERVNVKRCQAVLMLSKQDIRKLFWSDQDEPIVEDARCVLNNFTTYLDYVFSYMNDAIKKEGVLQRTYHFAKDRKEGRIYVEHGKGLQSVQNKLRNYIAGEFYFDVDLVNAHPRLLMTLAEEHNLPTIKLKEYVEDRSRVLETHDLSKRDILIAIYRDGVILNKKQKNNQWYVAFVNELNLLKKGIYDKLQLDKIKSDNSDNPVSSRLAFQLGVLENDIIQFAMNQMKKHAEVPMFDGFLVNKDITGGNLEAFEAEITKLNKLCLEKFGHWVEFAVKPTTNTVDLPEVERVPAPYADTKKEFEKRHFLCDTPYTYYRLSKDIDGFEHYIQLSEQNFKSACKEYKVLVRDQKGKVHEESIYNQWIEDVSKRRYSAVNFVPFNKNNTVPPYIFNTFNGFAINLEFEGLTHEPQDVSDFFHLINCLCNHDSKVIDYLVNYLAHLIQYPNFITEKIIVFQTWTGTGKDTLIKTIAKIIGESYVSTTASPAKELFGEFNELISNKLIVMLNEMKGLDGMNLQNELKNLSTTEYNNINAKHKQKVKQSNFVRLIINSNNASPVQIDMNDRRYVVINSSTDLVVKQNNKKKSKENQQFWTTYYECLKNPHWRRSVYLALNDRDLSSFNVSDSPVTEGYRSLQEKGISPVDSFLHHLVSGPTPDWLVEKNNKFYCYASTFYNQLKDHHFETTQTDLLMKLSNVNQALSLTPGIRLRKDINIKNKNTKMTELDFKAIKDHLFKFFIDSQETIDDSLNFTKSELEVLNKKYQAFLSSTHSIL